MLNSIIDASVKNRLLVLIALCAAGVGAYLLLPKLSLDAFPDVTNVQVQINTEARGLAAEEVEQLITFPIEAEMYSLPDVEEVRSISKTGLSVITVAFKEGVDIYFARQLVFQQLQRAKEQIPAGIGIPGIGPNTSGLGQIYQYILRSDDPVKYDAITLRSYNDWIVKLLLMPVDGVTEVLSFGGEVKQYQVQLDPQRLLAYGLSSHDVAKALEDNNHNAGGWYMDRGAEQLIVRGVGWIRSGENGLNDIRNVPLKNNNGTVVRVSDVAKVAFGAEIRQGAVSITRRDKDGNVEALGDVVAGIVLKRIGANTKATINAIESRMAAINTALPKGVTLEAFYNQASLVDQAVSTVIEALLIAFVFIIIVLMLFLVNFRATLLVLISIPISIGLALMAMAYWGISANLMSLGGLAIAIGMMIDGSVVMMEHIYSKLTKLDNKHLKKANNLSGAASLHNTAHDDYGIALQIKESAKEVARPVVFAVMVIVIVFAPLFSLEGVEGKLFQPMAISIVLAMLASLMVALIVVPALATYFFKKGVKERKSYVMIPMLYLYNKMLPWSLNHKKTVIGTALFLFIGALALVPQLGTEFVPELEEGTLNIRTTLAPSSSLKTSLHVSQKLEAKLLSFPEVLYAASRIGRPEVGGDPEPVSNIETYVGLKPVSEWTSASNRIELQKLMEAKMSEHPGLLFSFSQPIATSVDELLSGVRAQLAIKLFGSDLNMLAKKGAEIEALVKQVKGTVGVAMEQIGGEAQLVIRPDRDKLAVIGISVSQVMDLVSGSIGGRSAGQVINGNERYDIYVRLGEQYRNNVEAIRSLILQAPNGAWVKLGDVAEVKIESGSPQIRRDDVQRRVVIQANVEGRDMGGLVAELQQRIDNEITMPAGYTVVFGGQFKNQQRAQARLMLVVPLSLGLIFLLLYFAFNSAGQAMLIMLNVPLALIGGIAALYFTGQYLSVPGSIGFITLFGVAVLNGVVMVNAINNRVSETGDYVRSVIDGAQSRLRPVLMTATTTALGLIPMLISTGIGSEVQRPLATVVVGGLLSSTLLTLFVIPVLYEVFSKNKNSH